MNYPMSQILEAFGRGEIVVVTDDKDREGEGDLVIAAVLCNAEKMAFIIRHTSGIVCAPITIETARRLRLDPMVSCNDSNYATAFTVSIDYKPDNGTGISADERASCCRALANPNASPNDFARPGHVFPLIARDGGVLFRSGHTEAAIDLCRLSNTIPVGIISELVNDDGTVMKGGQVERFAAKHGLKEVSIDELIAYRQARETLIERFATFATESPIGVLEGYAYRSPFDSIAHIAFVHNGVGDGTNVLTRFHKPNIIEDIFAGPRTMESVLAHFRRAGNGVLVCLRDGAAGVPVSPITEPHTVEADRNRQWREVGVGAQILRDLGVTSIRHLTSTHHDYMGLSGFGIEIASIENLTDAR
ncbi:3,4-dihydroxy-2-butanone-4-phosphate synthase [Aminobacter anthyllidis]|uniref:3,4-dihydroxy-2-butanone 4-phosphate synthase n=1 Tax=Aminobacter anthyllidis TaxID=1035067 RepID=A0A9X1D937_9HYPH|nr:3,4-dihydroxy-2-butanone-4-phosphate synthase [Aminobacter anthyllidis]MBT1159663.1 3,4-dihydroxy-2-butanone-4-phosphate synthase [Aminobacter anthyllidis]